MALKFYNLPAADEDQRSSATNLSQPSATHRHADFDARDGEHCSNDIDVGSGSVGQQKTAKIPPRLRILSAAAKLFLRHGIAGVSVEAIAKAAGSAKPTLYNHFVSKDELVTEYLREPTGPFGGEKNSGIGRFGGEWILREFTRDHWVTVRRPDGLYPF
jgi:hypothetical protein